MKYMIIRTWWGKEYKIIYLKNSLHNPEGFQGLRHLYMRTIIILKMETVMVSIFDAKKMEEQFYEYSRSNGNSYATYGWSNS